MRGAVRPRLKIALHVLRVVCRSCSLVVDRFRNRLPPAMQTATSIVEANLPRDSHHGSARSLCRFRGRAGMDSIQVPEKPAAAATG